MKDAAALFGLAILLAGSMPAASAPRTREQVFRNPAIYVGKEVRVCGYLAGPTNLTERHRRFERGLSLASSSHALAVRLRDRGEYARICVSGTVSYLGCESGPRFCTDAAYDYLLTIRRVLSP